MPTSPWPTERGVAGVRSLVAATVAGAVACTVAACAAHAKEKADASPTGRPSQVRTASPARRPPLLTGGPFGVRSSAIAAENARPGTRSWRITGPARPGFIEGYADTTYAAQGQRVVLRVSTSAPSFRVTAYRIGWYGGAGAREVWRSGSLPGRRQPACTRTGGVNMVSCQHWTPSLTVRVTAAFVPGDYLFKLVGLGRQQSYVPLTVWDPTSHATYLVKNDVFTWQAWNTFGGYDFYVGRGTCPPGSYPLCSRARVVSFDRPYDQHGAGSFLSLEAPLVWYLERHHLDVSYVTDVTVAQHPGILGRHRAVLSLGHDECWSLGERLAAVRARRLGTNLAFFGASAMLRHVRLGPSSLGTARELIDYRDPSADPLLGRGPPREVTGNTWSDPPASWPENDFVGEDYNGFLEPGVHGPLTVTAPRSWAFRGTGATMDERLPGVIASDVDSLEPGLGHPPDVQVLAHSVLPTVGAQAASSAGGTFSSDMTYYTDPRSGAGVWDSGTNNWIPALDPGQGVCPTAAAVVQRVTGNLLALFGTGPAGRHQPSRPDWWRFGP